MNEKSFNAIRLVLLIGVVFLVLLTGLLYFYKGSLNIGTLIVAAACLLIYFFTGKKQPNN